MISDSRLVIADSRFVLDRRSAYRRAASAAVVRTPTLRELPRVNPRLCQLTVAEATNVPNVGLPFYVLNEKVGPVAWQGPIVMNTRDELRQAYAELHDGTFIKHS